MKKLIFLIGLLFLCSCSHKIIAPVETTWQQVPCEYKLTGDDELTLNVRIEIVEFDSAKIIVHSFFWTVYGDTLSRETTSFPQQYEVVDNYTIFILERCLSINSVMGPVELWIKK